MPASRSGLRQGVCRRFHRAVAEDDEWNAPELPDRPLMKPEAQDRFRRLLTELMFCLAGAPVFGFAAAFVRPPLRPSATPWVPSPPRPDWEVWLYRWMPLALGGLAFGCLVWAVLVMLRLTELRKGSG